MMNTEDFDGSRSLGSPEAFRASSAVFRGQTPGRCRTVLITGGNGDLGQALSRILEADQWNVLRPGKEELDVASELSVANFFQKLPELDLLINNAGVISDELLPRLNSAQWDQVMEVNLRGSFLCTQKALAIMQARKSGHVIFIGSRSARFGPVGQSAYAASKAALVGLSQSLAREYGSDNLRFNVVFPGFMETKMTRVISPEARRMALDQHVLGRFNTVESAARGIVFLNSLENVSGQVFQFDSRVDAWT